MVYQEINPSQLVARAKGTIPCNQSSAEFAAGIVAQIDDVDPGPYPPLIGISGSQGSGKSTLAALAALAMREYRGWNVAILSIDDFYLTKAERQELARTVHPLCATRGVPGTHDMELLSETLSRLLTADAGSKTPIPRFDKLQDDRVEASQWEEFSGRPDCILLEGWCVGLPAHRVPAWTGPINGLEQDADPDGVWIRWAMDRLTRDYGTIWKAMDGLVAVRLADIESVVASRLIQERGLVEAQGSADGAMTEAQVRRFVEHYERFTLALWDALPDLADLRAVRDDSFEYRPIG